MDIWGGVTQRTKGDVPITVHAKYGVSFPAVFDVRPNALVRSPITQKRGKLRAKEMAQWQQGARLIWHPT
jgi:hypothetical protein